MSPAVRRWLDGSRQLAGNLAAQVGALASLALATLLVARLDGAAGVGDLAVLRLLPWLVAVVLSGGLPGAVSFFLAGATRADPRLAPTILAIVLAGGAVGAAVWVAGAPLVHALFLRDLAVGLVAWAALKVLSRLLVITAKASAQGTLDLAGSNLVILLEELCFLPAYAVGWLLGARGGAAVLVGLVLGDAVTLSIGWGRLTARGFWRGAGRPSAGLARRIVAFGTRAQVGSLMTLVNLRLDFLLLSALAGSAVLGTYAIASRYAELLRLPQLAVYWVFYPRFARDGRAVATARTRYLLPRLGLLTALAAVPLAAAAPLVIPLLYGEAFRPAVLAAQVLLVGLAGEGLGGVVVPYLYGTGRPGLNSLATGAGLAMTVALDLLLIPRYGLMGAAVASCVAYLTTTASLFACFRLLARSAPAERAGPAPSEVGSR